VSSLTTGVTLLELFLGADTDELGVREMSRRSGLSKSNVQRLATELAACDLLEQNPTTGGYRLGLRLFELGSAVPVRRELHDAAATVLASLMHVTGETAHLGVLDGTHVVYVAKVESDRSIRLSTNVGGRKPTYCTGVGKALLAFAGAEVVRAVVADGLAALTDRTITDGARLDAELAEIRRRGYAVDDEEYEEHLRCVAAPVLDHTDAVIAAVSIAGPAHRMTVEELGTNIKAVLEGAKQVSRNLGYRVAGAEEQDDIDDH
jgi:IclR family transcriptional regulator, KDG regulon repressor